MYTEETHISSLSFHPPASLHVMKKPAFIHHFIVVKTRASCRIGAFSNIPIPNEVAQFPYLHTQQFENSSISPNIRPPETRANFHV